MPLSPREAAELRKIITIAEKLLAKSGTTTRQSKASTTTKRTTSTGRRKGKELIAFSKMVKMERKRGVPVADIARKHGITANYIYQIT